MKNIVADIIPSKY